MSGQNKSHAVMQQRHEAHDSLDDFPTPPWATRALMNIVLKDESFQFATGWEPCCNRGYMARPMQEEFLTVFASDIHNYGWSGQDAVRDFLFVGSEPEFSIDWIFGNPPFRLAQQFIERASGLADRGFAMLVRSAFLEGVGRYNNLFSKNPPSIIAQFAERVPMVKGRFDPKASTATAYTWLVWINGKAETRFVWVPPCRKQLEREGDSA